MDVSTLIIIWLIGVPIMGGIGWTISSHKDKKEPELNFLLAISAFGWLWPFVIAGFFPLMLVSTFQRVFKPPTAREDSRDSGDGEGGGA